MDNNLTLADRKNNMKNVQSESVLRRVINSFPGHVFWKDINSVYLGCNTQHAISAGLKTSDQIVGLTDYDLLWKDKASEIINHDKSVIEKQQVVVVEEPIVLPGKTEQSIFLSQKMPYYDETGELLGIIGMSQDVTELKKTKSKLEEALQQQDSILARYKQFVEDQEHDIRTPVGSVVGATEILPSLIREQPDVAVGLASDIHNSAKEILAYQESLIHDLYAGTRTGTTIFARFNLPDILKRIHTMFRVTTMHKKQKFTYHYDKSIPDYLIGDGKQVYQCLLDLVSNAVRFTQKGSIHVDIKQTNKIDDKIIVRFEVSDTGIGIPEDRQRDIYEAFVKVSASNKGGDHGRGLGLTRVHKIVNESGGELWFTSKPGKGSCFSVAFPFSVSVDQA